MAEDFFEDRVTLPLADVTAATFAPHRGEIFEADGGEARVALRLHEVHEHGAATRAGGAFSLTFVAPPGPYLPQAIYRLTQEKLGTLDLFLVPIGPIDGGNGYEVVFT